MATIPTPRSEAETAIDGGTAAFSNLHPDKIEIQTHILTRLVGSALASAAATCSQLYVLSSQEDIWANLCRSTWPSTSSPRVRHLIRSFPNGCRSFFSDSSTIPQPITTTTPRKSHMSLNRTPELISAVDLYYGRQLLLSRVVETETISHRFRKSTFRVDMLEPNDVVQTPTMRYPELAEELRLGWIVIDAQGRRAMNVSSQKPVRVQRHLLREVPVKFASVMGGEKGSPSELALCNVSLRLLEVEGGKMQVREVVLGMEDMDGMSLNGRESLVILQRALEGERQSKNRAREGYRMFGERKMERMTMKDLERMIWNELKGMTWQKKVFFWTTVFSFLGLMYVFGR